MEFIMVDTPKSQDEDILHGEEGFSVKGKPTINLEPSQSAEHSHIGTLLKQKVEEIRQRENKNVKIVSTTAGAEFKPENIPYIPGSTHPLLLKHDNATIERNAGFQDRALVHPMYADQMKPKEIPVAVVPTDSPDIESNIDSIMNEFERLTVSQVQPVTVSQVEPTTVSQVQPVTQGKQPEFEMKVSRDRMHSGGTYMPNESRPYRPGD